MPDTHQKRLCLEVLHCPIPLTKPESMMTLVVCPPTRFRLTQAKIFRPFEIIPRLVYSVDRAVNRPGW